MNSWSKRRESPFKATIDQGSLFRVTGADVMSAYTSAVQSVAAPAHPPWMTDGCDNVA
jgi:hypothetical protein